MPAQEKVPGAEAAVLGGAGRELAHQELGSKLLNRVKDDTATIAKVESDARFEGRQMIMILAPR